MQNKSFVFNIFASIFLLVAFLCAIVVASLSVDPFAITGSCLLIVSLVFAIVGMCTDYPLLAIGTLISNSVSIYFLVALSIDTSVLVTDYGYPAFYIMWTIPIYLLTPLSNVFTIAFLVGTRKKAEKSQHLQTGRKQKETIGFVEELQSLKTLLDNAILTQQEFDVQKQSILKKYGLAISEKNHQPETKHEKPIGTNLPSTYKCGNGIHLVVQDNKYSFVQTEGNKPLFGGAAEISQDNKQLTLHRTNAPDITMEICSDGLKLPNGGKYTKIK